MAKKTPNEPVGIDKAIARLFEDMEGVDADSPEYAKMMKMQIKLHKMKILKKEPFLTPAQWLPVAGNLLGILIVTNFERANVLTSKAMSLIIKSRT